MSKYEDKVAKFVNLLQSGEVEDILELAGILASIEMNLAGHEQMIGTLQDTLLAEPPALAESLSHSEAERGRLLHERKLDLKQTAALLDKVKRYERALFIFGREAHWFELEDPLGKLCRAWNGPLEMKPDHLAREVLDGARADEVIALEEV